MIHHVITTANLFPNIAKFILIGVENNKTQQSDIERWIEYVHSVAVYKYYLTRLGEMIIFSPGLERWSVLPTSLGICNIRQHYIYVL